MSKPRGSRPYDPNVGLVFEQTGKNPYRLVVLTRMTPTIHGKYLVAWYHHDGSIESVDYRTADHVESWKHHGAWVSWLNPHE